MDGTHILVKNEQIQVVTMVISGLWADQKLHAEQNSAHVVSMV